MTKPERNPNDESRSLSGIFRTLNCPISLTPGLQPGGIGQWWRASRFNGFGAHWQTVKTVRPSLRPILHRAEAPVLMRGLSECEISGLAAEITASSPRPSPPKEERGPTEHSHGALSIKLK